MKPSVLLASTLISVAALGATPNPLERAMQHYAQVDTYAVTVRSVQPNKEERMRYYFKKPGFVRMEFFQPHAGAVLVFNPMTRRVRLWPFGEGRFPELNLSPNNPLIVSSGGQHVDHSDVGALFGNARALGWLGKIEVDVIEGMTTSHISVTGAGSDTVGSVHRFDLWMDVVNQFPTKIVSRDLQGEILETVTMDALELNVPLPESLFNP